MVLSVPQNFSFFLSLCYITSVTNVTVMLSNGSHLKFLLSISFLSIFVQFPHTSHFSNKSINFKFFQTRNIMTTPTKTREFRYLSPSIYIQKNFTHKNFIIQRYCHNVTRGIFHSCHYCVWKTFLHTLSWCVVRIPSVMMRITLTRWLHV